MILLKFYVELNKNIDAYKIYVNCLFSLIHISLDISICTSLLICLWCNSVNGLGCLIIIIVWPEIFPWNGCGSLKKEVSATNKWSISSEYLCFDFDYKYPVCTE